MYRKYLQSLNLVSMKDDVSYTVGVKQSFYNNMYPFNLFPDKGLQEIEFAPITFFYGGNGSGKTTLLNVLAEKLELAGKEGNEDFIKENHQALLDLLVEFEAEAKELLG